METFISVIINVYNGEQFITRCLDSVCKQTYQNLEILIIDDGSTDDTYQLCKSYQDKRIRIIRQKNMGLSKARNVGIEHAKGEYLYFIDADDFIEPDTIELLYQLLKTYRVSIATSRVLDVYEEDVSFSQKKEGAQILSEKEMLRNILLRLDRSGAIWNKLIKKELFQTIRFEDRIVNDVVVTYKLVIEAHQIACANQIKYFYFRHKDSIAGKKNAKRSIDFYKASLERYEWIKQRYPDFHDNETGLAHIIMELYVQNQKEVIAFLETQGAKKEFRKHFHCYALFSKLPFREKIKLLLFRIHPNLCVSMVKKYLKLKSQ